MILTCPECATSYFVDDSRIPDAGRTVKCTSCGQRWLATKDAPPPAATEPEPAPAESQAAEAPETAVSPSADDDLEFVPVERDFRRARRAAAPPRAASDSKSALTVWVGAAALIVAVLAGAIVFRGQVIKLWPKSQTAYASLGLPVNSVGLIIEGVRAEPTFQGGRPVLSVTGALRNVKGEPVTAPPLRINLLDRAGKPIAAKVLRPVDPRIPAGESRHFAIAITDPPANAHDLEVVFETAPQRAAATPAAAAAPPAVEAQPLPAAAPEALTEHG